MNRIDAELSPFIVDSATPNGPDAEKRQSEMKERGMNFGDRAYIEVETQKNGYKIYKGTIKSNQSGDPLLIFDDGRKCAMWVDKWVRKCRQVQ